ncbi:hypothetical protein [Chitinophaga sp. HK235]|uniref:hypothetical protein n=1 Tax=Chitinophaga sp. HK235 TaxID=2952571 RepID=UPI001BA85494|nr:hypothetical protein [Chitinophaga sp. HK235]
MRRLNVLIDSQTKENKFSFYLSLFRILICLLLLKKLILQWKFIPLIFEGKDFLSPTRKIISILSISFDADILRENIYVFLFTYLFFIFLFLLGVGRNYTAFLVFILHELLQKLCPQILNGGDNILKFLLLYLSFADSFIYFTSRKVKSNKNQDIRNFLSNMAGWCICIHICMIYFISAIHKMNSDVWFHGVAVYYILNLERFNGTSLNTWIGNNTVVVVLTTYGTLFLELLYPILVWLKRTKMIIITAAILLHTGIAIFMMLYDFQLVFILIQGFFIDNKKWIHIYSNIKIRILKTKTAQVIPFN